MGELQQELKGLLNRVSRENESNTPDFILAQYLLDALASFEKAVNRRDQWWSFNPLAIHWKIVEDRLSDKVDGKEKP